MAELRKTPLNGIHKELGAKMVEFAGFEMPLQYTSIKDEHMTVRSAAGLFDVSHMGEFLLEGPRALETIDRLVTNHVAALPDMHALYTPICLPNGGIVDDCIVYRISAERILVVVNASNIEKDYRWFVENSPIEVKNVSDDYALLALQGRRAADILSRVSGADLSLEKVPSFGMADLTINGVSVMAARTGYTGEDGFEIFIPPQNAPDIWNTLMEAGADDGLKPAGLGARDTLRLEARLWLYGNDITEETTPIEAGMSFAVKFEKEDFIGREALLKQKEEKPPRRLIGFVGVSKGIARHGDKIFLMNEDGSRGEQVGVVTSGTKTPYVGKAIGLGYVKRKYTRSGRHLIVEVRGKDVEVEIVKGPFYKKDY